MTTQIAVRLPDELVAAIDALARAEAGVNRTDVVRRALATYVRTAERRATDEALVRGYTEHPPGDDDAWGSLEAQTAAQSRRAGRALDDWDGGWNAQR